jgi:flagellar export protein FliJ
MAFRYSLQSVLRLRRSLERQEEQRLFGAAAIVARLRADIAQLKDIHFDQKRQAFQEMTSGSSGAALQFIAVCDAAYARVHQALLLQLEQAEKKRMEQLELYKLARQKRETFEGLRDRQEEAYNLDFARHEQQSTDEAFLLRLFSNPIE